MKWSLIALLFLSFSCEDYPGPKSVTKTVFDYTITDTDYSEIVYWDTINKVNVVSIKHDSIRTTSLIHVSQPNEYVSGYREVYGGANNTVRDGELIIYDATKEYLGEEIRIIIIN